MEIGSKWRLVAIATLVLAALTLVACGGDDDDENGDEPAVEVEQFPANTTMGEIQEAGEITIGVKFDVPPFGFNNPESGEVEGFDVDLGRYIAERLGVEPVFREATSDNRIPLLVDGTIDLILSTMTITEERDLEIDFSEPYYVANGDILVPEGSDIAGIEDLDGERVCTALGSTYQATIKEEAPDADLRLIDRYSECLELIQTDAIDAISTDDVILTGMVIEDDTLEILGIEYTTEPYGAGVPEGDTEFKQFVDESVAEFIDDGTWQERYDEWVGQYIPEEQIQGPPDITLKEALKLFPLE
ncbi:MAG: glutamate ABC transporter substrate-binding protein [Microbacterium sp.]|uniref:glutamate ABC transporter substrate-binding protein n=1 Tax=Microbacterium sp. TaxID=51671 RepID=UPI003D6DE5D8